MCVWQTCIAPPGLFERQGFETKPRPAFLEALTNLLENLFRPEPRYKKKDGIHHCCRSDLNTKTKKRLAR